MRTSTRSAAVVAILVGAAACAHYTGAARPIDPARVTAEPGWSAVPATPTVRQADLDDCGPAALAMVAARWHVALDLDAVRAEAPPRGGGVTLGTLRAVARAHGLAAYAIAADAAVLGHEIAAGRPVIVGLLRPYGDRRVLAHYEVVIAMRPAARPADTLVVTIDPGATSAPGWQVRRVGELEAEWRPAGYPALVVLGVTPAATCAGRQCATTPVARAPQASSSSLSRSGTIGLTR